MLLFCWAKHTGAVDLELLSLLFLMPGAALLLFGPRFARLLVLPVVVLAFAIPPPGVLANHVLLFLRLSGAAHGAWLLNAVGFTAFAEGTFVQAGPSPAEVIESCSGLRSIQTLTFLAAAWASFYSVRVPHAVALIAFAPFIAYAVNVVRIAALALFPESDLGAMHSLQGVAMFLAGIGILALLDDRLRRLWPETSSHANRAPVAAREPDTDPRRSHFGMALAALLLGMVCASYLIPRWDDGQARAGHVRLPNRLGDWQFQETLKLHRQFLGSAFFGRLSYRAYERDGEVISVFVGYDDRRHRERSLLSPIHAFNRPGWKVEERAPRSIAGLPEIEAVLARFEGIRDLSYWWVEGSGGLAEEVLRAWLATDQSFLRRPAGVFVVRLTIDLKPQREARDAAERSLREFSRLLSPFLKAPPQHDPQGR